jgi:hypothetical protein
MSSTSQEPSEMPRRLSRPPDARAILMTGVEGGGVTLYGRETTDGWEYYVEYADQTPCMLDEPEIRRETSWTRDWSEAVAYLDRERWLRLPPVMVVPEFRDRLRDADNVRLDSGAGQAILPREALLARWRERCDIPS